MKKLLTAVALLIICSNLSAQLYSANGPDYSIEKENFTHIIIMRQWENTFHQNGFTASMQEGWTTSIKGFHSLDELIAWLNYIDPFSGKPAVRINQSELIKIYDLSAAKEIKIKLQTEEKSLPKRVEIQAEKWTEQKYVLQN